MEKIFPINFGSASNNEELKKIQESNNDYDPAYLAVASATSRIDIKKWIVELWLEYEPYADNAFLNRIKRNFHEHTWEMYLTCALLRCGIKVKKKENDEGPDCELNIKNKPVWIEAVTCSEGEKADKVIKGDYSGHRDGYEIPRILRITNAIDEKFRKYKKYLQKGTIKANEPYIIAVNGSGADAYREEQILSALLAVGYLTIPFDKNKKPFHLKREKVKKVNKSEVNTNILFDSKYEGISAVIFSGDHIINSPRTQLGSNFIIILNPLAKNPIQIDTIKLGKTRWLEDEYIKVKAWGKPK